MPKETKFVLRVSSRPGALGEVAAALWGQGVNIQSLSVDVNGSQAMMQLVVSDPGAARGVFAQQGWEASEEED